MNQNEIFYNLLRLSLGIAQDFPADVSADTWQRLYEMSAMQSLVGVCYQGVSQLPPAQQPPLQLAMQWACEAEAIRGMNIQQNEEAARLTRLFAAEGRKTAILKGQANARLYPDKLSRTPGDIDIWVEGGQESVIALLKKKGLMEEPDSASKEHKPIITDYHAHLRPNGNGITVEVHYLPSSGIKNPIYNRRLQRWLNQEIQSLHTTEEGFCVPTIRFALVMQLAHIHNHFINGGIGLRQLMDYYWLLQNATDDDLEVVRQLVKRLGLVPTVRALMWILQKMLHLEKQKMLLEPDAFWGDWMIRDIFIGGSFGHFRQHSYSKSWKRILMDRWRQIQLIHFDYWGTIKNELKVWGTVIRTLPLRIIKRRLSLGPD